MDNQKPQEAWNMATETLKRLARCLDMCSYYSQRLWLIKWFDASMDLRRNLSPFLDTTELTQVENKFKEFPQRWILCRSDAMESGGKVNPQQYAVAHRLLDELYMLSIKYMKEKGLLMPKTNDPRTAVINT